MKEKRERDTQRGRYKQRLRERERERRRDRDRWIDKTSDKPIPLRPGPMSRTPSIQWGQVVTS